MERDIIFYLIVVESVWGDILGGERRNEKKDYEMGREGNK